MTRPRTRLPLVLMFAALPGTVVAQETTGRLVVRTHVESGEALPGVKVAIASPSLIGGIRSGATDALGEAQFFSLAPGVYTVQAELAGFGAQERREVQVRLGSLTALTVVMLEARFGQEITVLAETPVVDPRQVGTEQVFDAEYISRTTIGSWNRFLWSTAQEVPGRSDGQTFFGSTFSENAWFVDGIDLTTSATGDMAATGVATYGLEGYQEVEVKTGGYEAEFGRALGAVVSVVMKSGGNSFSGSVDTRYRVEAFQEGGDHFDPNLQDESALSVDAALGGPILRDRLWFFAALYRAEAETTPEGSPTTSRPTVTAPKLKLTWQASESWRGSASYLGNTLTIENSGSSRWRQPEATGFIKSEPSAVTVGFDGMLDESLLWNLRAGHDRSGFEARPSSGDLETIAHINLITNVRSANFDYQEYDEDERLQAATDLTWLVTDFGGSHEVKGGLELSDLGSKVSLCATGTPGGVRCAPDVNGHVFYDVRVAGGDFPYRMIEESNDGWVDTGGRLGVAFLQDAWRPTPNFTVKAGLRYDRITYDIDRGVEVADMDRWQPRLGAAWDLTGDARNVLRASAGRYMDPATTNLPYWGVNRWTQYQWWSCSLVALQEGFDPAMCPAIAGMLGYRWRTDPEGWDPFGWFLDPASDIYGADGRTFAPDLESAYSDQLVLGYERALSPRSSVELSYVNKKTRGLFEDTCDGNIPVPTEGGACDGYAMANLPGLRRDYDAFMLRYESRTLDWLTLLASYTWSDSRGNHDWLGMATAYDVYPWHWQNQYGYLANHHRHWLRVNGFVLLPYDLIVGFNAGWRSAFRWTPQEDSLDIPEMGYGRAFVEPRGSREGYGHTWLDLQLVKGFAIGPTRLELNVSVLNVLSKEDVTEVCELVRGCGDFALGAPTSWESPRQWELGFRLTF